MPAVAAVIVPEPPKGEHIFPATRLTEMALAWKKFTAEDNHAEAFKLLEEIIKLSTPMFERLAQYEGFHHTVDLPILVQAAREKVGRWLMHCGIKELNQGKLFSWFSTCAKNAFRSEVAKQRQHSNRYHATSDSMEKYVGSEDHAVDRHDAAAEAKRRLKEISCRWGDPQELGSVRYIIDCLAEAHLTEEHEMDKNAIINGAMYAFGLSLDLAKFFYSWALFAMRDALFGLRRAPFTVQDVMRHKESYTFWPDVIDIIGWKAFVELVQKLGGVRLKVPTNAQLNRNHQDYLVREEMDKTDLTPEEMEEVARRRGRTTKNASELFAELSEEVSQHRTGEHPLYQPDEA